MNSSNKTFLPSLTSETRNWFIIDCQDQNLGRLASTIASLLKGKIKAHYYPSEDMGDYIILINANLIKINKTRDRILFALVRIHKPFRRVNSLV